MFGDRTCAFLNAAAPEGFPYLTARNKGQMLAFRPRFRDAALAARPLNQAAAEGMGPGLTPLYPAPLERLAIDVRDAVGRRAGARRSGAAQRSSRQRRSNRTKLSLVRSDRALTDCRPLSIISLKTIAQLGDEIGISLDPRRFRANIYADLGSANGFAEDAFVGKQLRIGERAVIAVLDRDPRCKMISLDPDTGEENSDVLRHVAKAHDTRCGVYCAVLTEGTVRRGDSIVLLGLSPMKLIDFDRARIAWTTHDGSHGLWRIIATARRETDGEAWYLAPGVMAGDVYGQGQLPLQPPYSFQFIASRDKHVMLREAVDTASVQDSGGAALGHVQQADHRCSRDRSRGSAGRCCAGAVAAWPHASPRSARAARAGRSNFRSGTSTCATTRRAWQVETGPIIVPCELIDIAGAAKPGGLQLAFAFFSRPDQLDLLAFGALGSDRRAFQYFAGLKVAAISLLA